MPKTKFGSRSRSAFAYDPGAGKMAARDATKTTLSDRARNLCIKLGTQPTPDRLLIAEHILTFERQLAKEELRNG